VSNSGAALAGRTSRLSRIGSNRIAGATSFEPMAGHGL
jgi:hypothetical protein